MRIHAIIHAPFEKLGVIESWGKASVPHASTPRKAREQVKSMVTDGVSPRQIRKYFARWIQWWNKTVDDWHKNKLIQWFCRTCFDIVPAAYAAGLLLRQIRESRIGVFSWSRRCVDFSPRGRIIDAISLRFCSP